MEEKKTMRLELNEVEMELILKGLESLYISIDRLVDVILEEQRQEDLPTYTTAIKTENKIDDLIERMRIAKNIMEVE